MSTVSSGLVPSGLFVCDRFEGDRFEGDALDFTGAPAKAHLSISYDLEIFKKLAKLSGRHPKTSWKVVSPLLIGVKRQFLGSTAEIESLLDSREDGYLELINSELDKILGSVADQYKAVPASANAEEKECLEASFRVIEDKMKDFKKGGVVWLKGQLACITDLKERQESLRAGKGVVVDVGSVISQKEIEIQGEVDDIQSEVDDIQSSVVDGIGEIIKPEVRCWQRVITDAPVTLYWDKSCSSEEIAAFLCDVITVFGLSADSSYSEESSEFRVTIPGVRDFHLRPQCLDVLGYYGDGKILLQEDAREFLIKHRISYGHTTGYIAWEELEKYPELLGFMTNATKQIEEVVQQISVEIENQKTEGVGESSDSTSPVVAEPSDSPSPVVAEPSDSTAQVVSEPSVSTTQVVGEPSVSTSPTVGESSGRTTPFEKRAKLGDDLSHNSSDESATAVR